MASKIIPFAFDDMKIVVVGIITGLIVWKLTRGYEKAEALVSEAVDKVNPVSDKNIFYVGASDFADFVTGEDRNDLGETIYCAQQRLLRWAWDSNTHVPDFCEKKGATQNGSETPEP